MKKFFFDSYKSVAEKILPILKENNFHETGMLTIDEYKKAGDYLIKHYPKWSWSNSETKKILEMKNIPLKDNSNVLCDENIDNFVIKNYQVNNKNKLWQIDEIAEVEDIPTHPSHKRRYDISITYDNYYRTPRIWFLGTDENDYPIPNDKVLDDISVDHSKVTVTIEIHPYYKINCISVHPCQHSNAMKFFIKKNIIKSVESNTEDLISIDKYFIYFIKFMACIIPNLEFDFTKPI